MDWKEAKRLASKLASKGQTATEQVLRSELTGKAKDLGGQTARKVRKYSSDALDWGEKNGSLALKRLKSTIGIFALQKLAKACQTR